MSQGGTFAWLVNVTIERINQPSEKWDYSPDIPKVSIYLYRKLY